jgi:hypothetical protein
MNKHYVREEDKIHSDFDDAENFGRGVLCVFGLAFLLIVCLWCASKVYAATTVTRQGGTGDFACCEDANCDKPIGSQYARDWAAKDACQALTEADGKTRYFRQWPMRVEKVGAPPPPPVTCPPAPASTTRTQTCPAGTTGSWQQTSTSTVGAAPACTVTTTWAPVDAPAGACATTPPPTPSAPANLAAAVSANTTTPANSNVTLTWTAVTGVDVYEVHRCAGATCTNFAFLADVKAPETKYTNSNIPGGTTVRYKVRAWQPVTGPFSDIVTVTMPTQPPPQANGSATIKWEAPTQNTDGTTFDTLAGFRIVYGTSATVLSSTVTVSNPGVSSYVVTNLAPGTWYFAVRAYSTAGYESADSNVASKVIAP